MPTFDQIALSLQRALVGEVLPSFRAICLHVSDEATAVTITHEGMLPSEAIDDLDDAMAEVYEDFPELGGDGPPIIVGFDRRDAPSAIPAIGVPIFAIKGTQFLVQDG